MLHAFAVAGASVPPGTELWALLPGEQLGAVRTNGAALDGSPNVGDIFETIGGTRRWRTLLTIPQGRGGPSVYGLDVSDPTAPALLWHRGPPQSGVTLGSASGAAMTILPVGQNPFQSVVVIASSAPSGGAGITVSGLRGGDGSLLWQWTHRYTRTLPGTPAVVPNDVPPPAVLGPAGAGGRLDDRVYVADLEGKVWALETATGRSVTGMSPLCDVGLTPGGRTQPIGAPPALYVDRQTGHLALLLVTGGADWAHPGDTYAVYGYDLEQRATDPGQGVAARLYRVPLLAGARGYAAPTVSGNDVYVLGALGLMTGPITASVDDAGVLYRINLSSGAVTATASLTKGAGAFLAGADGTIYGSTARDLVKLRPAGADTPGQALRALLMSPLRPRLWLEAL
jgi:hypothetical protein